MAEQLGLTQSVPIRSAELRLCPECQRPFEPYKRAEGRQLYCSPECRTRHWKVEHGQAKSVPISDKRTRAEKVLERLKQGRATGLDLLKAGGGTRYGARIHQLREKGYHIHGPVEVVIWDRDGVLVTLEAIPKTSEGWDQYELRGK